MPKSLDQGPTSIVPVRMPETEKSSAKAECEEGETLSAFIREATRREVNRRRAARKRKRRSG